jgi:quinol monooxygenase YgiN
MVPGMMLIPRRDFVAGVIGIAFQGPHMDRLGLHGKVTAHPGQRDTLVDVLLKAAELVGNAPGCELYFVATSPTEADAIWVTEVWRSETDHKASLSVPGVKELISRGRPLIAAMEQVRSTPIGGKGLAPV